MRFQRLFGDTNRFALNIGLRDDPAPPRGATEELVRSWGELQIWVAGTCLTQHTQADGSSGPGLTWFLSPLFEWLDRVAVQLLNREPFPFPIQRAEGGTALAWLDSSSEGRPLSATEWDDDAWFDERYAFWNTHALRAGLPGAAAPHVVFHRVGDEIEVSWENESAPPPRPGLQYVNSRGARLVAGEYFASTLRSALKDTVGWLKETGSPTTLQGPLMNGHGPGKDAWRWLLPAATAERVEHHPRLRDEVTTSLPKEGAFVCHTLASSLLRGIDAHDDRSLAPVVDALRPPQTRLDDAICELRSSSPAYRWGSWKEGYRVALHVRERLSWTTDRAPDLLAVLPPLGVDVGTVDLPNGVECAAVAYRQGKGRLLVANAGRMSPAMRAATALGHLLLDTPDDRDFGVVSSRWIDAPTVARAKAFGAMLLMPEDRVREVARQSGTPRDLLRRVMDRFGTTQQVTEWHLYHLRLLDENDLEAAAAD